MARRGGATRLASLFADNRTFGVLLALVATFAVFTILEPRFLDVGNVIEIGVQSSIIGVVALGMTLVIVTHGIDLSVGSIVGLVSVICATNLDAWGVFPTIAAGLVIGGLLGMINGSFSALFNLESFVVTLATLNVYRGLAFLYTDGRPIFGIDDGFRDVFGADLGFLPKPILFLLGAMVVAYLILNWSRTGTYFKAIGTNELAARKSGVAVERTKIMAFTVSGVFAGLGALLLMSRIGAAEPISGTGYELTVIAAVVVGGTSLGGGRATIVGTILGALLLGSIRTGLTLYNVSSFWQLVVTGVIILVAVLVDRITSRAKATR